MSQITGGHLSHSDLLLMIADPAALCRMLKARLQVRRQASYERLATCLPNDEYHKVCGMVKEDDALLLLIDEVYKTDYEDDDDHDPLTTPRKSNGKVARRSTSI